jgi:hypothetical protein
LLARACTAAEVCRSRGSRGDLASACSLQQIRIATGYVPVSRPSRPTRRWTPHRQRAPRNRHEPRARRATWKPTWPTVESGNTHEEMLRPQRYLLCIVTTEWNNVSQQRKRLLAYGSGRYIHTVAAGRMTSRRLRTGITFPAVTLA